MGEEDIAVGFSKYASTQVLSVERETAMSRTARHGGLATAPVEYETLQTEAGLKQAHRAAFEYTRRPGYIYVRSRAISSRTNDNYDEFPAEEIKVAYRTFVGKPVFVNHHNDDHRRARGVIIDAALHEDTNPNGTPDTWVEVLMEVDAKRFPRLAAEVLAGNIARTSMGTNVEYSVCTACGNKAYSPVEYCQHIPRMKGMKIRRTTGSGGQEEVLIAERCYGLGFFENSLLVEDPADPTAFVLGVEGSLDATAGVFRDVADSLSETYRGHPTKPTQERHRQEERDRINSIFDGLQQMVNEGDEDYAKKAVRAAFDGVTVSREDIATWRPDPGDVIVSQMREAMKTAHWDSHPDHKHKKCRFPTYGISSLVPCGKDLLPGDFCPDHGPQANALQMAAATNKATCDECQTPYDYSRINGTATFHVPSNGMRGGGHQPAHDEKVDGVTDDEVLWHFECPVCGYDNSQYTDADAYRELLGFRYDTNHTPYQHEYPATKPHTTEESIPAGSSITELHNEHDKGYGTGGTDALTRSQQAADADVTRQHKQLWRQHHPGEPFQGSKSDQPEPATDATAICDGCDKRHPAEYSHEGEWNQGHIYAVTCDVDGLTSYHTEEGIDRGTRKAAPYIDFSRHDSHRHTAVGEVKAPAQVDTMRAERCPVCQDDEAYDGDRCGICGYVAPPEMFQDPDLEKAQQVDLRQDQMEQVDGDGNMAVDTADVEGQTGVLTCDACGEEFGPDAEGQDAPDDGPAPATDEAAEADPDAAGDPTQQDRVEAPDDLSDLADKTDDEIGIGDDEVGPDAQEDPLEAESPVEQDPTVPDDESGVAPPVDDGLTDSAAKGDICPICGQGTIVSIAPAQPASPDAAADPKETSRDMPEQDPKKTPVNPAKAARNRIVEALLGQQRVITAQQQQITALRDFVLEIGTAAGLDNHPRFAALRKSADDTNQTPETAPATTSDEARKPDATDDVNNVGATGEGANVNVTPQAVTDVASTDKVEPGQPPLSNLVDVTAPTPGANNVPAPGDGDKVINPVTVGTPSNDTMDPAGSTGWKSSSVEDPQERYTASLRLARLRIAAGLARGEDLAVGEAISKDASLSLDTIKALAGELSQTISAQQAQAPTRAQAQRLVPRSAQGGRAPSLAAAPDEGIDVTASSDGSLDEWAIGMDSLTGE